MCQGYRLLNSLSDRGVKMQWRNAGSEEGLNKRPGHSPSQILGSLESFKWRGHDMLYINFNSRGHRSFCLKRSLGRVQTSVSGCFCIRTVRITAKVKRITAVVWGRRAEVSKILLLRIAGSSVWFAEIGWLCFEFWGSFLSFPHTHVVWQHLLDQELASKLWCSKNPHLLASSCMFIAFSYKGKLYLWIFFFFFLVIVRG